MTSVFQSAHRLATAFFIFIGLGLSHAVSAQCDVDADTATVIQKLQRSRDLYTVTGTFLRESAAGRDFVSLTRGGKEGYEQG